MQLGANTIHHRVGFIVHFTHGGNLPSDMQEITDRSLQVKHKKILVSSDGAIYDSWLVNFWLAFSCWTQ